MPQQRIIAPNLALLYEKAAEVFGDMPAFATRKKRDQWEPTSYQTLWDRGCSLAAGLVSLGVQARDKVGLFADNRLEWILSDYAVQIAGAADVPRGSEVTVEELRYILEHAEIKFAFVENRSLLQRFDRATEKWETKPTIILLETPPPERSEVLTLAEVEKRGAKFRDKHPHILRERIDGINPEDLFTLIYTSGTTGTPKGVMLSHANMISQLEHIPLDITWRDRILSLLPIWHIFERVFEMITLSSGACTYYSSPRRLAEDLVAVEPSFMGSAPRLWESLHHRIRKGVRQSHPVRRALFATAYWLSKHYHRNINFLRDQDLLTERPRPAWRKFQKGYAALFWFLLLPWYGFFNATVLERIRQVAGGGLKATVSGGGALPREIDEFFNNLGIAVLEGYGLTETSPVLAVRTPQKRIIGTVGPIIPETQIRIVDLDTGKVLYPDEKDSAGGRMRKGEIIVRGPQIMEGYYRNPEATKAVLQEGWFRTGDLGMVTWNDCLQVVGRCKETIVLSNGENMEPGPIEMRLRQLPGIGQCMVVGQDQRYPGLLVSPDPEELAKTIPPTLAEEEQNARMLALVKKEISPENGFKAHETPRVLRILSEPFTVGDDMTKLYKLRRHAITEKYANLIARMFADREKR
ncbi:MAG: long-chain fatty acid--CoA ligase [Opitutales bacterium]|nr:long-chain fatty acid--CoA ligase [Opitutales bacterium]MCH8539196.1 long-chain fatty acid--CoA ligase [Opitutales bacterium]